MSFRSASLYAMVDGVHGLANASSAEQLLEAAVAVGLVVLLLEGAFVQLLQAERADEVLRVEFAEHRGYTATWGQNGGCNEYWTNVGCTFFFNPAKTLYLISGGKKSIRNF